MSYTYDINITYDRKAFNAFCRELAEKYPDYELSESKDYSGNSVITKIYNETNTITAELDTDAKKCTVTAPFTLEIDPRYIKGDVKQTNRQSSSVSNAIFEFLFGYVGKKYLLIPAGLILVMLIYSRFILVMSFSECLEYAVSMIKNAALCFGWFWLIPLIPIISLSAYSKAPAWTKAASMSPVFLSALYVCSIPLIASYDSSAYFGDTSVYSMTSSLGELLFFLPMMPMFLPVALPIIYFMLIPYMVIDDICTWRRKVIHKAAPSKKVHIIGWISAAASVFVAIQLWTIVLVPFTVIKADEFAEESDTEENYLNAQLYKYRENYGNELMTIAEYSLYSNYSDWSYCPEETFADEWAVLFTGAFDKNVYIGDDYVNFTLPNEYKISVYPESGEMKIY